MADTTHEADYAHEAHQQAVTECEREIMAKRPTNAKALIVAEFHENDSDLYTDYHNHRITRRVAIGWRTTKRESFKQLRRAAWLFDETAHLGPAADKDVEHRENYSMGAGNYVKDGHSDSDGWCVKSYPLEYGLGSVIEHDRLPELESAKPSSFASSSIDGHIKAIRAELTSQSSKVANLASDRFCPCETELREVEAHIDTARRILFDLED